MKHLKQAHIGGEKEFTKWEIDKVGIEVGKVGIDQVGIKLEHNSAAENSQRGHVQLELVYMCSFSLAMDCSHLLSENSQIPSYSWNKISLYSLVPIQALPSPQRKINTFAYFVGARGEPGNKVNTLLAVAILCIHCTSCIKCHKINQKKQNISPTV